MNYSGCILNPGQRGLSTNDYIKYLIKEFPKLEREFKKIQKERKEK